MRLVQIAELAGVSVSTVSKAFSGSREIGEATREEIFRIAKELGCFEKYYKGPRARRLTAVLVPELESEYYGDILGALEIECRARGGDTVVAMTRFDPELEAHLFSEFTYRLKVDSVILVGSGEYIRNPDAIPLAIIGRQKMKKSKNPPGEWVKIDVENGMREALEYLKALGHRQVGFIGEPLTVATEGLFREEMRRVGLVITSAQMITAKGRFEAGGYDAMLQMIKGGRLPTAIFTAYDYLAVGAIAAAKANGISVPRDLSVITIGDMSPLPYLDPPLTAVCMKLSEAVPAIFDLLEAKIENRHYASREPLVVATELVIRGSVSHG